nr:MAG TPA: hypothetical protein [Bacteriophage sp.]
MMIMIVIENYNISIIFSLYKDMLNFWVYDIICLLYLLYVCLNSNISNI